jgi:glycosyltransferase involved in cell wall biosynthesis
MTARRDAPWARTVVLEMLGLVPGRIGGMETYARHLARALPALDDRRRYVAALGAEARGLVAGGNGRVTEWVADARLPAWGRRVRPLRTFLQSMTLARHLRRWAPDIVHCMLMFPKPPWGARNMVLTIPDLNFELLPDCWGPLDRRVMSLSCRLAARMAEAILTVSEFSRRMLVETYGVPFARVHVTPLGVERALFRAPADPGAPEVLRHDLGLPTAFLLFPANTWPHKNHLRLLDALTALRASTGLRPSLVLTGFPKHGHPAMLEAISGHGLGDQVRWLGYVNEARLAGLYRAATALVFPSLHEGFGLPVLEAMASGCPVACASTTATGETAGDAALTFDPADTAAIAEAIRSLLGSETLRRDLARRGLARAAEFSWEGCARQTLRVYDEVISRRGTGGPRSR